MPRRSAKSEEVILGRIKKTAGRVLRILGVRGATVGVFLLGDSEMRRLKYRFLKKKDGLDLAKVGVVDVLAFPEPKNFPHPEARERYLGDIYLNKDLAGRSGRLQLLLVHGLLHLFGFSHKRRRDILKMESLEKELLQKLAKNTK